MHGIDYTEAEYGSALPKFYETIHRLAPHAKLIWASTTIVRTGIGMKEHNPFTERIKARNNIAANFFKDKSVIINDLFSVIEKSPEYYVGSDGTHPNKKGVQALANRVSEVISDVLGYSKNNKNP